MSLLGGVGGCVSTYNDRQYYVVLGAADSPTLLAAQTNADIEDPYDRARYLIELAKVNAASGRDGNASLLAERALTILLDITEYDSAYRLYPSSPNFSRHVTSAVGNIRVANLYIECAELFAQIAESEFVNTALESALAALRITPQEGGLGYPEALLNLIETSLMFGEETESILASAIEILTYYADPLDRAVLYTNIIALYTANDLRPAAVAALRQFEVLYIAAYNTDAVTAMAAQLLLLSVSAVLPDELLRVDLYPQQSIERAIAAVTAADDAAAAPAPAAPASTPTARSTQTQFAAAAYIDQARIVRLLAMHRPELFGTLIAGSHLTDERAAELISEFVRTVADNDIRNNWLAQLLEYLPGITNGNRRAALALSVLPLAVNTETITANSLIAAATDGSGDVLLRAWIVSSVVLYQTGRIEESRTEIDRIGRSAPPHEDYNLLGDYFTMLLLHYGSARVADTIAGTNNLNIRSAGFIALAAERTSSGL